MEYPLSERPEGDIVSPEDQQFYEALVENIAGIAESADMIGPGYSQSIRDLLSVAGEGLVKLPEAALYRAIQDALGIDLLREYREGDEEVISVIPLEGEQPGTITRIRTAFPLIALDIVQYQKPPEEKGESEVDYQLTILEED